MARVFWEQRRQIGCCLALQGALVGLLSLGFLEGGRQPFEGAIGSPELLHLAEGAHTHP